MGFSKKQHLQQNIDALRIAFKLEKEKRQATVGERLLMMRYSGFGGLKFVLNPIENEIDINISSCYLITKLLSHCCTKKISNV